MQRKCSSDPWRTKTHMCVCARELVSSSLCVRASMQCVYACVRSHSPAPGHASRPNPRRRASSSHYLKAVAGAGVCERHDDVDLFQAVWCDAQPLLRHLPPRGDPLAVPNHAQPHPALVGVLAAGALQPS